MQMILAIDDDPIRYTGLTYHCPVIVTCRIAEIRFYLEHHNKYLLGICLDHDMPLINGEYVVNTFFLNYRIPSVAIVSNNPIGAQRIANALSDLEMRFTLNPARPGEQWSREIMNYFVPGHNS